MSNSFDQFKLRVNINADLPRVYKAWSTSEGLESWFLRKAIFRDQASNALDRNTEVAIGNTYEWYWHGYPDSVVEKGSILKSNGKDHFSFTFSLNCAVTIRLSIECDETLVELVESELPTDEQTILKHYVGDSKGWLFYLVNLKSVLEGGLDLRNKKLELVNVITA